jgi:hypothetical protein
LSPTLCGNAVREANTKFRLGLSEKSWKERRVEFLASTPASVEQEDQAALLVSLAANGTPSTVVQS